MASVADLQKFAEQVKEAQALLANKEKVEAEIRQLKRTAERMAGEVCGAEDRLAALNARIAEDEQRFQYEKRRHQIDLDAHVAEIAKAKQAATDAATAALAASARDVKAHADKAAGERKQVDADLASLLARRNALVNEIQDFQRRIAALPS